MGLGLAVGCFLGDGGVFLIRVVLVFCGQSASEAGLATLDLGLLNGRDVTQAMLSLRIYFFQNGAPSAPRHMPVKCNHF